MRNPEKYLTDLGLSDSEIKVYLSMIDGAKSAREIMKLSQLKRPTTYYALSSLEKRGLINKSNLEKDNTFNLEPLDRLTILAEEKLNEANKIKKEIEEIIPELNGKISKTNKRPYVSFYEGKDTIKRIAMSALYCKNKMLYSMAPKNNFFSDVGNDFKELFIKERNRRCIKAKNLWDEEVEKSIIKKYYNELSEIRVLPKEMAKTFTTTVFIYDDKTLYISSLKNNYCVLITSEEHRDLMLSLFNGLWKFSKPHEKQ